MHTLPKLDIMIQYSCSLSCFGCVTMSDQPRTGGVSIAEGEEWLSAWSKVLTVDTIGITGGEPLLNPDILEWIRKVRQYFPSSHIKVVTNGMHLTTVPVLPLLLELGNATLDVSFHLQGFPAEQLHKDVLAQTMDIDPQWITVASGVEDIPIKLVHNDVTLTVSMWRRFTKPYHGVLKLIRPWKSKYPSLSHSACGAPADPILYKNRIYKCGPIANLRDLLSIHELLDNAEWQQYLKYKGFGVDEDLQPLVDDFGKPNNKICTMCSADARATIEHYEPAMVVLKHVQ